jgi:GNAT superfamily N-acetyltransferase
MFGAPGDERNLLWNAAAWVLIFALRSRRQVSGAPARYGAMSSTLIIQRFASHEWPTYRDLRLRALVESPDAFGSTFDAERVRLDADWAQRMEVAAQAPLELPLVARVGDEAIGLAWARIDAAAPETAHLFQVWVAPEHRGRGAGRLLLEATVAWARTRGVRELALDVTCGDTPAVRLYSKAGFRISGDFAPLRPGSRIMVQPMRLPLEGGSLAPEAR